MPIMSCNFFILSSVLLILQCVCQNVINANSFWSDVGFQTDSILRNCLLSASNHSKPTLAVMSCLQRKSLLILQRTVDQDVISLGESIKLVKWVNTTRSPRENNEIENVSFDGWKKKMLKTIANVFTTHTIKINMHDKSISETEEGRRRRKGYMELYIFGLVALGTVMVPMGFKFLAVLGGKAILLAKMALLLASIQGLKKLATSDIHYGLYQAPPIWYDRKSQDHYPYYPEDYYENYPSAPNYPHVKRVTT